MLRTFTAALVLTLAAGVAGAANLRVVSADCDPNLSTTVGLGIAGKICSSSSNRNNAGRVHYGAPDGAFYPLGLSNGIVFDPDPAFMSGAGGDATGQGPTAASRAVASQPGAQNPRANSRADGGGVPAAVSGNPRALSAIGGAGGSPVAGQLPEDDDAPIEIGSPADGAEKEPQSGELAASPIPVPLPAAGFLLLGALGALTLARRHGRRA